MKHKAVLTVLIVLIVLTVGFIWNNSRKPEAQSNSDSRVVTDRVERFVKTDAEGENQISYKVLLGKVRKAAHAVEFFALGLEMTALCFVVSKKFSFQKIWNVISAALTVAVTDESIQILSGRGPKVEDILLDLCGASAGILIVLLIWFIALHIKKEKKYGKA